MMAIAAVIGVIFYRITVLAALYMVNDTFIIKQASLIVTATAAVINLVVIFILSFVSLPFMKLCESTLYLALCVYCLLSFVSLLHTQLCESTDTQLCESTSYTAL